MLNQRTIIGLVLWVLGVAGWQGVRGESLPYAGGEFLNAGTVTDGLVLEEGYDATVPVTVPLVREVASTAVRNVLVCNGVSYSIDWAATDAGVKYVDVTVPAGVSAGTDIPLELFEGEELHSRSKIRVVAPTGVTVHNPLFLGERAVETLAYGEWTMDYVTAREKVLKDRAGGVDAKMLVFITGTLWCPNCFAMYTNLLEVVQSDDSVQTPVYDWARSNHVVLVFFDQGRAGTDEAGFPNGMDKPRLLSYLPYGATSGADYMSRHRISLADAFAVKTMVGEFSSSRWLAPETTATRLSQPTLLLVDPETETVSARFSSYRDATPARVFHIDENLARLDDLLLASPGEDLDGYATTTRRRIVCGGGVETAGFQINGKTKVFAIEEVPHARVTFSVSGASRVDRPIQLSVVKLEEGATVELAKGEGMVDYDFTGKIEGRYFLKAAAFGDAVKYGPGTSFTADFSSTVTPIPGAVAFDEVEQLVHGSLDEASFKVARTGGASGSVSVKVALVEGGTAVNGSRMQWEDAVLSWADGEIGEKVVRFQVLHPGDSAPREDFRLRLEVMEGSVEVPSNGAVKTVVILDTARPMLAKEQYSLTLYAGFDAGSVFAEPLYNVDAGAKVMVKSVSGKLPRGLRLVWDEATGMAKFSGVPVASGAFTSSSVFENRGGHGETGPEVTLNLTVVDPKTVNPFVSTATKLMLPLFRDGPAGSLLDGVLDLSISKKNRISAKYVKGGDGKSIPFYGVWASLGEGTAATELVSKKGGYRLKLSLDVLGYVRAEILDPSFADETLSSDAHHVDVLAIGRRCAGSYTAVLPEMPGGEEPAGSVPMTLKISEKGEVKWSAKLADGTSASGKTSLTLLENGLAFVPVFRVSAKGFFAAPVIVRPEAAADHASRAVRLRDGSVARWRSAGVVHDCKVWGSYYDMNVGLDTCCFEHSLPNELVAYFDCSACVSGERIGAVRSAPEVVMLISGSKITPIENSKAIKLSFSRKDGMIKGSGMVTFEGGDVKVTIVGAVIPGWYDCGCEDQDPADPFKIETSMPFATGAAYFRDSIQGRSVKRSFVFNLGVKDE